MGTGITGTIFCRNAIKFDYCVLEAIDSLLPFCERVIVMDCSSDDGTKEMLEAKYHIENKITLVTNEKWEVGNNYDRLAIHANTLRKMVRTKWHFMLQADEVVHEDSIQYILEAINSGHENFFVRRYNLWGNPNLYIKFDSNKKPVGDLISRLALNYYEAQRDAESLDINNAVMDFAEKIKIIHYGFVRKGSLLIDKIIDMQSWFWGQGSQPDAQVVAQKAKDYVFDAGVFFQKEHLAVLPFEQPAWIRYWLCEHENDKTYRRIEI